jgi:hypothetical protein
MVHMGKSIKVLLFIVFCLAAAVSSSIAAPMITSVTGTISNGQTVTISGSGFGTDGPTVVLFDDFEKGPSGSNIMLGSNSAQIGHWDSVGDSIPKYDNTYKVSGNNAMMVNCQTSYAASFETNNLAAFNRAFLTYWVYMPASSTFPTNENGDNWKIAWLYGSDVLTGDIMTFMRLGTGNFSMDCNGCRASQVYVNPAFDMIKGHWYRVATYIDASTYSGADVRQLWVSSPVENKPITQHIYSNQQLFSAGQMMNNLSMNGYCRQTAAESRARFDDVYLAIGPNARARIEIGDSSTYGNCKNLTMVTPTVWNASSITGTVRQGSFASGAAVYLYVTDSNGNVNSAGYPITFSGSGSNLAPAAPYLLP